MAAENLTLPLIYDADKAADIASCGGQRLSRQLFLKHATALSLKLPGNQYAINLCQDRYHFMVAFAATILARQVCLLPSNQSSGEISKLCSEYTDSYVLSDTLSSEIEQSSFSFNVVELDTNNSALEVPLVAADQLIAIVFTSGSTGQARANMKTWGTLYKGTQLLADRFGFGLNGQRSVVSTVVPQHMFGLETSILLPMLSNTCIHAEKPFYPADVCNVLYAMQSPGVLVTTPVHLKACVNAGLKWPEFEFVLSATAPLSVPLANSVQEVMGVEVKEIFGCTEAGSFASRSTVKDAAWRLYDSFSLQQMDSLTVLQAPHLSERVELSDQIEQLGGGLFKVLGRSADMMKIAGKRASLADLNFKLNSIEAVHDGVFFVPKGESEHGQITRLSAFIVAPDNTETDVLATLSEMIDSVFLPRPLIKVKRLPYNEIGKLPRRALEDLYRQYRSRSV